jgi:hypothetical protein
MVEDFFCVFRSTRQSYGHIMIMNALFLFIFDIVWWAFINNKHKLSKLNNDFIFKMTLLFESHTL